MLRHVSIIRSSSGSCLFLAKITLLKTFTALNVFKNVIHKIHKGVKKIKKNKETLTLKNIIRLKIVIAMTTNYRNQNR